MRSIIIFSTLFAFMICNNVFGENNRQNERVNDPAEIPIGDIQISNQQDFASIARFCLLHFFTQKDGLEFSFDRFAINRKCHTITLQLNISNLSDSAKTFSILMGNDDYHYPFGSADMYEQLDWNVFCGGEYQGIAAVEYDHIRTQYNILGYHVLIRIVKKIQLKAGETVLIPVRIHLKASLVHDPVEISVVSHNSWLFPMSGEWTLLDIGKKTYCICMFWDNSPVPMLVSYLKNSEIPFHIPLDYPIEECFLHPDQYSHILSHIRNIVKSILMKKSAL